MVGIVAGRVRTEQSPALERLASAGGAGIALAALVERTDELTVGLLAAVAAGFVGWAVFGSRRRTLLVFVGLNCALALLLGRGAAERARLSVEVAGDRVVARLGEVRLDAIVPPSAGDRATVSLAPATDRPLSTRWAYATLPLLSGLADSLNTGMLAGLDGLVVLGTDARLLTEPSPPIWQSTSPVGPPVPGGPLSGWELAVAENGGSVLRSRERFTGDHRIEVDLIRPSSTVTVGVRAPGEGDAVVAVVVAPDLRSMSIDRRLGQGTAETVAGGQFVYKRSSLDWIRAIAREVLRPWLWALLALGTCRAIAGSNCTEIESPRARAPAWLPAARIPRDPWILAVLGAVTLALAGTVARGILEGIPHVQDSVTYLFQAQVFALGRLSAPAPPLPEFFEQEFVLVHAGRWFGKYPPGQPLALALGVALGAPWIVSPVLAAGAVICTFLAGRRLYGAGTGLLGAGLLIVSPFFLFMSGSMMAHPAGLFWMSLGLFAAASIGWSKSPWPWIGLGAATGMLLITRPLTAAVILPALAAGLARLPRRPSERLGALAWMAMGATPPTLFLLLFNWSLLGDPFGNPYELWWAFDRPGFGPGVGMHGPHDPANGLSNTWANTIELMRHLFGWPGYLTLAPALLPSITLSRRPWDWLLTLCPVTLAVSYVFFWADGIMYGPRFYYEGIGAIALLTARGLSILANPLRNLISQEADGLGEVAGIGGLPAALVGTVLAMLVAVSLIGYLPPMVRLHQEFNGVSRARLDLVERAGVTNGLVFVTQNWPDWQPYGSVFPANGPLLDGPAIYARDLGPTENSRLMDAYPARRPYLLRGLELYRIER